MGGDDNTHTFNENANPSAQQRYPTRHTEQRSAPAKRPLCGVHRRQSCRTRADSHTRHFRRRAAHASVYRTGGCVSERVQSTRCIHDGRVYLGGSSPIHGKPSGCEDALDGARGRRLPIVLQSLAVSATLQPHAVGASRQSWHTKWASEYDTASL